MPWSNPVYRLAIIGLTFQYTTSRISRMTYEKFQELYSDEVSRLNPIPAEAQASSVAMNSDDFYIRSTNELRFTLYRHWTIYDAMFHSSYIASKLGLWKEKGRQRLTGLLAKMGYVRSLKALFEVVNVVCLAFPSRKLNNLFFIWTKT